MLWESTVNMQESTFKAMKITLRVEGIHKNSGKTNISKVRMKRSGWEARM